MKAKTCNPCAIRGSSVPRLHLSIQGLARIVLVGAFGLAVARSEPARAATNDNCVFGRVTYPALGNIRMNEGTIEAWVTICFDPYQKTGLDWYSPSVLLDVVASPDAGLDFGWGITPNKKPWDSRDLGKGLYSQIWGGFRVKGRSFITVGSPPNIWRTNQTFHFAFSWKDRETWLYIDGKLVQHAEHPDSPDTEVTRQGAICLGSHFSGRETRIVLSEFRISSVARRPEELGFHGVLKPDPYTLLLDHFDKVTETGGQRLTKPEVMAVTDGVAGGMISSECRLVESFGRKAIALFTIRE